jgi:hypothetical protein
MWRETLSKAHDDAPYWFNVRTRESSWTPPETHAWRRHTVQHTLAEL